MSSAPSPSVSGPTAAGARRRPFNAATFDLSQVGYEEVEHLFEGEVDGHGEGDDDVVRAPYRSRMLIRRPVRPSDFGGKVLVEWLNVSGGGDIDIAWPAVWPFLVREGWAYVGVTAQPWGVLHLRAYDEPRYGNLEHPGIPDGEPAKFLSHESYSAAVFSDAGRAVRSHGSELLGGPVTRLLAHGQSQSAVRLGRYVRDEHPVAQVYDGFLVHAGGGFGPAIAVPDGARVFQIDSEAEIGRAAATRQADTDDFTLWEIAGSAHTPVTVMEGMYSRGPARWNGAMELGPHTIEYPLRAAVAHLDAWAGGGAHPPSAPLIDAEAIAASERAPDTVLGVGTTARAASHRVLRDEVGNARGGARLPHLEVPLGRSVPGNGADPLLPGYVPFDDDTLRRLYESPDDVRRGVADAAARAVAAGWLLADDVDDLIARTDAQLAERADVWA